MTKTVGNTADSGVPEGRLCVSAQSEETESIETKETIADNTRIG